MTDDHDNALVFSPEQQISVSEPLDPWKVMIVDDEPAVHQITNIVLGSCEFQGKRLELISAFSSARAREILNEITDIAVILLDVVMETEHAGLDLVRHIREKMNNKAVRIILRTGQPGLAPEERVIVDYDINDYKAKTELTAQKLKTTIFAALRSWRDITTIEKNRKGLEKIIESSANLFEIKSFKNLAAGALYQLAALINADESAAYIHVSGFTATKNGSDLIIVMGSGRYEASAGKSISGEIDAQLLLHIESAVTQRRSVFYGHIYIGYIETKSGAQNIFLLENVQHLTPLDIELIDIFCMNVGIAFENINLNSEMETTHREVIMTLGEVIERRSHETGFHVRRVSEFTRIFARALGLTAQEEDALAIASALHDVGKIGIPDHVLGKPSKLDIDEWEIMKTHSKLGEEMLVFSQRPIFRDASLIARQHHERWDGNGYPAGLRGEEIDIKARITAIADVFDALSSERVYRHALTVDETVQYIVSQAGSHFDPTLVKVFQDHLDEFLAVHDKYKDSK